MCHQWGYGATVARVTHDHKVGSLNLSGLIHALADMWRWHCKVAASEDRTHGLRIMRPTRCQLRYRRSMHVCHSTSTVARSRGCALASRARPWQHTRNVAARGLRPAHACGARSMRIAPTTLVALASEPPGGGGAAGMASTCVPAAALLHMGLWRNGSACDSRSQGWEFESLWPHPCHQRPRLRITCHGPVHMRSVRRVRIELTTLGL